MTPRRFPPWTVEETHACFTLRDANGQALAFARAPDRGPQTHPTKPAAGTHSSIAFNRHFDGDGAIIYKHLKLGCEGIVSTARAARRIGSMSRIPMRRQSRGRLRRIGRETKHPHRSGQRRQKESRENGGSAD
jgi:hypothetical protein